MIYLVAERPRSATQGNLECFLDESYVSIQNHDDNIAHDLLLRPKVARWLRLYLHERLFQSWTRRSKDGDTRCFVHLDRTGRQIVGVEDI